MEKKFTRFNKLKTGERKIRRYRDGALDRFQVFVMERSFERSVISLLLSALQLEFEIENWIQLLEFDIRIYSISYLSIFILYSQ